MKRMLTFIIPLLLGVAIPMAGVELFGYLIAHSLFSSFFESNYPNLAVYSAMALGWLPFVVFSALILGLVSPKPVWLFSGVAALTTTLFYFVPSSPEGLSLPHTVVVLVVGWLVVPFSLGFSRLTCHSSGTRCARPLI